MAATPLPVLLFLGSLATLASVGMARDFDDDGTDILLAFFAAITWGLVGLSSFDVYVNEAASKTQPVYPLAGLGVALASICALFGIQRLLETLGTHVGEVSEGDVL